MTASETEPLGFNPVAKITRLRQEFADLPGFKWVSADRGRVEIDDLTAIVRFDSASDLRFELFLAKSFDPLSALGINTELPFNLRFALEKRQLRLVADARSDDFVRAFQEIVGGARQALGRKPRPLRGDLDKQAVEEVLRALPKRDDSLVELDDGWEYRPRICARPIAVKVHIRGEQLRCHRSAVQIPNEKRLNKAVAVEALRINTQLKHARLVLVNSRLVAETRLSSPVLHPATLAVALRAVALAERRSRASLSILVNNDEVAGHYSSLFDHSDSK